MSQPPLGALRVFEAVARHGSFSRAADELCVTQSAVRMPGAGLLHDADASGWRGWFAASGAAELAVAEGSVFEDFNLLRAAALAGRRVALCPLAIIADDLREGWLLVLSETSIRDGRLLCGFSHRA